MGVLFLQLVLGLTINLTLFLEKWGCYSTPSPPGSDAYDVCGIVAGSSGFFGNFLPNIRNDRNNDTRIAVIIMSEHARVRSTLDLASEHALNW